MTVSGGAPLYLTLAVPAGPLFGNVAYVEHDGGLYASVPTSQARSELAGAACVVVTFGAGRLKVPGGRDEAELGTLADGPPRRAKLVAVGGNWMRVDWLPEEPEAAVGLVRAAARFALGRR